MLDVSALADPSAGFVRGGFRIHVESGAISSIESRAPDSAASRLVAFPGFVQPHLHLCQTLFRGMGEGRTLLQWLEERIWPLEAAHTEDTLAASVISGITELIRSGCTGLVDMGSVEGSGVTVDILRRTGVRAAAANSLMDAGPSGLARDLGWLAEESKRVAAACGGLVQWALAPRFALSASDALWEMAAAHPPSVARTTHAAEAAGEVAMPVIVREGGNIRFLERRRFLGPRTLLAHCVHLRPGEAEIMAATGTSAVHCPWANLKLGSGIADAAGLSRAGVRLMTASDGAACSNSLDAASAVKLGMGLMSVVAGPGSVDSKSWLASITSTPASVLGWPSGRLEAGLSADLAVIECSESEAEELETASDPLRYLLELHWPSRTVHTIAAGRFLMRDRVVTAPPPMPCSVAEARRKVLERAGLAAGA